MELYALKHKKKQTDADVCQPLTLRQMVGRVPRWGYFLIWLQLPITVPPISVIDFMLLSIR